MGQTYAFTVRLNLYQFVFIVNERAIYMLKTDSTDALLNTISIRSTSCDVTTTYCKFLLVIFSLHFYACTHTEVNNYPPPDMFIEMDAASMSNASDMAMPRNVIGQACDDQKEDDICVGKQCITKTFLEGLGLNTARIQVQNGMCSMLSCQSDEECGEQAVCFNTEPLSGIPINICLAACQTLIDCRWEEGYSCFNTQDFDENAEEAQVCLPNGIAAEIYCSQEQGSCDETE